MSRLFQVACAATLVGASFAATAGEDFAFRAMERHGRMVYEDGIGPEQQERLKLLTVKALDNITRFYGERKAEIPELLFCRTTDCAIYFGGKEWRSFAVPKGGARHEDGQHRFSGPSIVIVQLARSPTVSDAALERVLTHELSHIEMRKRLAGAEVPAWFNEGLATHVAGTPCKPGTIGIAKLTDLTASRDWTYYTRPSGKLGGATYCQASLEVGRWIDGHGGPEGLVSLLREAHDGRFYDVYGKLETATAAPQQALDEASHE